MQPGVDEGAIIPSIIPPIPPIPPIPAADPVPADPIAGGASTALPIGAVVALPVAADPTGGWCSGLPSA